MKTLLDSRDRSSKGAALMIVLAFVVLLTGVALAYFSRAGTDRQLAQSSYNDTSADLLARSALDIVVSDFKQEIINDPPTATTADIQPARYGDASIPNLIRRSYSGAAQSRASTVSSTAVSANGRSINTTRWNSHYLIPRGNPSDTSTNPSPTPTFIAPDWVLVTAQGPAQTPAPSDVMGRYAFAVYDEGGLLDMTLAGYPSWPNNTTGSCDPAPTPWLTNVGRKGTVSLADLTALGAYAPPQEQVDKIVGWRNYATTQQPGSFSLPPGTPAPSFTTACARQDSYGSYLLYFGEPPFTFDANDQPVPISDYPFSSVATDTDVSGSRTDQAFMTRQQLLKLRNTLNFSQNVLQYMGTFSRERNKPAPDWPFLGNNLSEGRFAFDNLDLVKPNPEGCTHPGKGKGKGLGKSKGRGHLCGDQKDIVNMFGLYWVKADPLASPTPKPGYWRYINHNGKSWDPNPNPHGKVNCWRGPKRQNDFFQVLQFALNRLACDDDQLPGSLARTFAIGASLIDQYDSDADDLDTSVASDYQTHTTVIEYSPGVFAYGMEPTSNGNPNRPGDCAAGDTSGNCRNHPHRPSAAPTPIGSPTIVNHAFSNIGEFGYAIDNTTASHPTLNFYQANSPDKAVLDFFGYNPVSSTYPRTGIVNLNTKNAPVLATVIKGAAPTDGSTSYVNQTAATNAAQAIVTETTANPALTRADSARLAEVAGAQIGASEEQKETIARALAEVGQTRTWNLMIDVIAQTGRYAPGTANVTEANKFTVEGEKRYWLHVALGRDLDNGQVDVLGTQLEGVTE